MLSAFEVVLQVGGYMESGGGGAAEWAGRHREPHPDEPSPQIEMGLETLPTAADQSALSSSGGRGGYGLVFQSVRDELVRPKRTVPPRIRS